ncbi:MAG: hypothetical protein LRY55_10080 [Leadbetterella sp.]|nr:hypothetical protein [Leadbetterella sp.]
MKTPILKALHYIRENRWEEAHEIAQSNEGHPDYDRVHALLHRIEGDEWNAKYWYRRCGRPYPSVSIEEETEDLIRHYS